MGIDEVVVLMETKTLKAEQAKEALDVLEYEIDSAETIVADGETELHSRREFQGKLRVYTNLKNRLRHEFGIR